MVTSSMTLNAAEQRLTSAADEDGNYLLYDFYTDFEAGPVHGNYILLVYYERNVYQWKITRRQDSRFILEEGNTES